MKKLVTAVPGLEEKDRAAIAAAAEKHGYACVFYESEQDALPDAADAEIIFGKTELLTKKAPLLRWMNTANAGVNQFLTPDAFAAQDAVLTNSSGAYGVTIAEHVLMLVLEMLRRQPEYNAIVKDRRWKRDLPVRSICGSRVTMLGTGDIGCECARRVRAFGPKSMIGVSRSGRNPEQLFDRGVSINELNSVLKETDILIMSLPGTPETNHLMNAERLSLLPDGALIVNVGRGTAIDEKALEAELRSGRLTAALDVFEKEPLPVENTLWECPNLLITPHAAGNTTLAYTKDRIIELFIENFNAYCEGRPLQRVVDRQRGY